ncbi:MAG: class I SAM-dependent methyltransferase [Actinomycetota bacterium]
MADMFEAPLWDQRYDSADGYLFGTRPAAFLTANAERLTAGASALVVADGEGRNSVYLAEQGVEVTAMDISSVGATKARALATERGVTVDVRVADVLDWRWEPEAYDLVVAVFIQFLHPEQRSEVFAGMTRTLRPGGRLLLHGYRPEQLSYGTGGPPLVECLYTEELLTAAFADLEIERLAGYDADIEEGTGHVGRSALIDLIARKPDAGADGTAATATSR